MKKQMTRSEIKEAISEIERCYGIGKDVLKKCTAVSAPGEIEKHAIKHGVNRDKAQKLRAMAAKETGYTAVELKSLYQQFRKARFALTISHFVKLVSVPKGKARDKLTTEAIEDRWSTHRLQAEIVALLGRRQVGGRKPTVVVGDQFEDEFTRVLWSWDRWLTLHLEANEQLDPKLREEAESLQRKMGKLLSLIDAT
ncbi:MAG: hypothetical protein H8E37_03700 [Planctomycetes bacterium]|nr:hypothetical protein [Planctomycetota bacterium]